MSVDFQGLVALAEVRQIPSSSLLTMSKIVLLKHMRSFPKLSQKVDVCTTDFLENL
jgi:hypothetical protein